jgi:hypothetical protein
MTVPIENGAQVGILVTSAISIFIAAFSVALRIVAKIIGFGFDLSDYCILAALVSENSYPVLSNQLTEDSSLTQLCTHAVCY